MGLFDSIFGKKKQPAPAPAVPPKSAPQSVPQAPADPIAGLTYMDVRNIQDPAKRVRLMMTFAEKGDGQALYEVGQLYAFGQSGVKKDVEKAKEYFFEAGKRGVVDAIAVMGQVCIKQAFNKMKAENSSSNTEDRMKRFWNGYDEGVGHLAYAITCGNVLAMDTVAGTIPLGWNQGEPGEMLMSSVSRVVTRHLPELKETDAPYDNYTLGLLSMRGICMPQDLDAAKAYFQRSAVQGHAKAKQELKNPLFADDEEDED